MQSNADRMARTYYPYNYHYSYYPRYKKNNDLESKPKEKKPTQVAEPDKIMSEEELKKEKRRKKKEAKRLKKEEEQKKK